MAIVSDRQSRRSYSEMRDDRIQRSSIVICGFSQGAYLATESVARRPATMAL